MELKSATIEEIKEMKGKNALVIISNGQMKVAELPQYGTVTLNVKDGKVTNGGCNIGFKF